MGCKVTLTVIGNKITYDSNLNESEMILPKIVEELLKRRTYDDKDSEGLEGYIPSVLHELLVKKQNERYMSTELKKSLQKGAQIVGNYSLDSLKDKFPQISFDGLELNEDEDIIFDRALSYDGLGLGGKVKIGNKSYFILSSEYGVAQLRKYLTTRKILNESELDFSKVSNSVRKALDYIKDKKGIKTDQGALRHFFNNSSNFLYDVSDNVDIFTTLSDFIKDFRNEYVREDYDDPFVNAIMHRASYKNSTYYMQISDLKKLMPQFEIEMDEDLEPNQIKTIFEQEMEKRGHPIKINNLRANSVISFKNPYQTFETIGFGAYNVTELAMQQEVTEFPTYGYKIFQIRGNYYVTKQTVLTQDSNAKGFNTLTEAENYIEKQIKNTSLYSGFNRGLINIPSNEIGVFKYTPPVKFTPAINTVINGITNYDGLPAEAKLAELIDSRYVNYLNRPISDLIKDFNLPDGYINSYEEGVIFLIELSKTNRTKALNVIKSLQHKDFLVVNKFGNELQLQQISDVEDKWKKEKEFSIPVIVPLTNLASRINTRAGKELVKIITTSDFNELPENVNKNANGFIYNGIIYINASRAKMSDLTHELGHLFLGMMKAANMETYMQLIKKVSSNQVIINLKQEKAQQPEYQFLADEDLTEEAFVDLFGNYIFKTGRDLSNPLVNSTKKALTDSLKEFGTSLEGVTSLSDIFKNFSTALKDNLYSDNGETFFEAAAQQRRATNYISNEISKGDEGKIKKDCK